jgi:hypothetical protein
LKLLNFQLLLHEQLAEVGTLDLLLRQRLLGSKHISKGEIAIKNIRYASSSVVDL